MSVIKLSPPLPPMDEFYLTRLAVAELTAMHLTREEVQGLVQEAYDKYDIIATPSIAKEAEAGRVIEDAREVSDQADYLAANDPAQTQITDFIGGA
ncbi:hypothetical protein SAMN05428985_11087 [Nocardioides sp. YR527]|nr:hypothetical protein SAMN05428985_11087 [Nocardioides sp. YR527]